MTEVIAIELAPFRLAEGVTQEALHAASERLEREFLSKCDGYVGRVLARSDGSAWADVVFWESAEHAARAMAAVSSSTACRAYFECMAAADHSEPGEGVTLLRGIKAYGRVPERSPA